MKKSGLYLLINQTNNRFYLGSSNDLGKRKTSHFRLLRKNRHPNIFLQRDFDKSKENSFIFFVLKEVPESNLLDEEQKFLEVLYDDQRSCYNIEKNAIRNLQSHRKKEITVVSPNGDTTKFFGYNEFARHAGISNDEASRLANGKILSSHGWRLPSTEVSQTGKTKAKRFSITLISPEGTEYSDIFNLEQFCKTHNLISSCLRHVIAGRNASHKGWTLKSGN